MPYAPLKIFTFYLSIIKLDVNLSLLTSDLSSIQATAHIHRYLTLDESILLESSADSAKGDIPAPHIFSLSLSLSLSQIC